MASKERPTDVPEFGITAEELQRLAQLVEDNNLSELRYEEGDLRVTLRTASYRANFGVTMPPPSLAAPPSDAVAAFEFPVGSNVPDAGPGVTRSAAALLQVEAPIMGVFYRSSAPGEPSFVEIGDTVEVGQVIGVIEAMKVFSEVPSEFAGRIAAIPAKNGGLVQPGDALVVLEAA